MSKKALKNKDGKLPQADPKLRAPSVGGQAHVHRRMRVLLASIFRLNAD